MDQVTLIIENVDDDLEAEELLFAPGSGFRRRLENDASRQARESSLVDAVQIAGQIASLATAASTIFSLYKLASKPNTAISVTVKDALTGVDIKVDGSDPKEIEKKLKEIRSAVK